MGAQTLIDVGIPSLVVFLMGLVGLRLEKADLRRVLDRPGLVAGALGAQLVLPFLALAAGWLVGAGPLSLVALVLIAACPAGVLSNVYTLAAGGNVALSVSLTAASTLLGTATLPLVASLGLGLIPGQGETTPTLPLSRTAIDLFLTILVPVGAGMAMRSAVVRRPRLDRGLQALGVLATMTVVVLLLVTQWEVVTGDFAVLGAAVVVFSLGAIAAGEGLARVLRADPADRAAVVLELPGRNLAVAAVVGVHSLGRPEIAGLATAVFVVQVPLLLLVSVGLRGLRREAASPFAAKDLPGRGLGE